MNIIIREACPNDYKSIALLNKSEMGYDYPPPETKKNLEKLLSDDTCRIYVAERNGSVIGYIHANNYNLLYAPHMKNIMGIAVSSDFRRNGAGKLLLAAVEQWANQTGACGVRLVSGASRTGAHAFYRSCGYTETKEQKNFKKIF